jgi:hypothetical protein
MRVSAIVAAAALVGGLAVGVSLAVPAAAATSTSGRYVAVTPTRVLNVASVKARSTVTVTVTGEVPDGASAAVLNLSAAGGTAAGYVIAYASNSRPGTSNLNYAKGQSVANLVVAPLRSNRTLSLYNGSDGTVHLMADLSGYYTGGTVPSGQQGAFVSVPPTRILNTATAAVKPRATQTFAVEGHAGVPANVAAVALNLTVIGGSAAGYLISYASGSARPGVSNLYWTKGQSVAGLAVVRTGGDGKVSVYNGSSGTIRLLADVQGYYTAGDPVTAGGLAALPPARDLQATTIQPRSTLTVALGGKGGVPLTGVSTAMVTTTVTKPAKSGYVIVYQGSARPPITSVNFSAGQSTADLAPAPLSGSSFSIYNGSSGTVQVVVDVLAYVISNDLPLPATSTSHYVRTVSTATGRFGDPSATGVGCADANSGTAFVLLDIGAQANDGSGVVLSTTSTKVSYANLVATINNYVTSYRACNGRTLEVAVGTNNSGDFGAYPATQRGTDWAVNVLDALTAKTGVTFTGANDIEGSFTSTEAQAQQWETAFLAGTSKNLIYNGSLDGCPDTYGAPPTTCSYGWTQADYHSLTHNGTRISVLPQIYVASQARQWANLVHTTSSDITFRGSLTEHGAGCATACDMVSPQGWAFLYHALSTVVTTPSLPVAEDLDILS